MTELKKIELRKKEREKKQKDLQKLISAAEQNAERLATPTLRHFFTSQPISTCVHVLTIFVSM